jgi:hypothetical protein
VKLGTKINLVYRLSITVLKFLNILGIEKELANKCTIKQSTYRCIWVLFLYLSLSSITTFDNILAVINPHNPLILSADLNSGTEYFNPSHSRYGRRAKD